MTTGMRLMLEKHEYEYLQAYNIFVKRKEAELRDFISEMESRTDNKQLMDAKIRKLENERIKAHHKQFETESQVEHLKHEVNQWKAKLKQEREDKEFYHKNAIENKKKLKLAKIALKRLEMEYSTILSRQETLQQDLSLKQSVASLLG